MTPLPLKTKISVADTSNKNDALDDVILEMFNEIQELEITELEIDDNYTDISDIELPTRNSGYPNHIRSTSGSVLKLALGNIFIQGRTKIIKIKYHNQDQSIPPYVVVQVHC